MTWFDNIYKWIMDNIDVITAWLSAGGLGTVLASCVLLVRNVRAAKNGSYLTDRLNDSLVDNNKFSKGIKTTIESVENKLTTVDEQVNNIEEQFVALNDKLDKSIDIINSKIGAMMEVQSLVYSTVKDEDMRNNINKILTSAKYNDTGVQMEIAGEIAKMQSEFATALENMQKTLKTTVQNVNEANKIPGSVNSISDVKRY